MYAIIEWGGKQYRVEKEQELLLEKVPAEEGETFTFDRVLFLSKDGETKVGNPYISDIAVKAKVVGHQKGKKVLIFKYRRRHKYRLKKGHRQQLTKVAIEEFVV